MITDDSRIIPSLSDNPLDEINTNAIRSWLKKCDDSHTLCQHNRQSGYTPSRLLKIVLEDEKLVLWSGVNIEPSPQYAALSYCWGPQLATTRSYRLTSQNITDRHDGFYIKNLPQTLKDAVTVCIQLGINYIWIDVLCIIQDDSEDWKEQAGKMCEIFENAYLTIAAIAARTTEDGFLNRSEKSSLKLRYTSKVEDFVEDESNRYTPRSYAVTTEQLRFEYPHNPSATQSITNTTWHTRGWTFQEQVLSTRTLYFTENILVMYCLSSMHAEDTTYPPPKVLRNPWCTRNNEDSSRVVTRGDDYLDWYSLMTLYSGKQHSFIIDKLPAIAGLAHKMSLTHSDDYIAGLWTGDLSRGLLWTKQYRAPTLTRSSEYVAPSWSWASVNGIVQWSSEIETLVSELSLRSVTTESVDQVKQNQQHGTVLIVYGKVMPLVKIFSGEISQHWSGSLKDEHFAQAISDTGRLNLPLDPSFMVLVVGTIKGHSKLGLMAKGLILEPALGVQRGANAYRRIGTFECPSSHYGPRNFIPWRYKSPLLREVVLV